MYIYLLYWLAAGVAGNILGDITDYIRNKEYTKVSLSTRIMSILGGGLTLLFIIWYIYIDDERKS